MEPNMPDIISLPSSQENVSGPDINNNELSYLNGQFGYYETKNFRYRKEQEDALTRVELTENELKPAGANTPLTPVQIGHRLWTSYQVLDTPDLTAGTTASTTVYDGRGNLITATLADAAAFAVAYDKEGKALGVIRLNTITHKPTNKMERQRIENAGGFVAGGRVSGRLAVSRAIGDTGFKSGGVCSEATIDITSINNIISELNKNPKDIGFIQIITTCDGFTDGANSDDKNVQEQYLFNKLGAINNPGKRNPIELAKHLVEEAKKDESMDNISVAIQNITNETTSYLLGVYDGHGGTDASEKAATCIGGEFKKQCALTQEAYAQQTLSVDTKKDKYERDNNDENTSPQDQFEQLIKPLQDKIIDLRGRPEATSAYDAAVVLRNKLKTEWKIYVKDANEETYKTFKDNSEKLFDTAHQTLDKHRGWSNFLANLVIGIFTAGLGLLVKGVINKTVYEEKRDFFFFHQTKSAKVLEDVKENLFPSPKPGEK